MSSTFAEPWTLDLVMMTRKLRGGLCHPGLTGCVMLAGSLEQRPGVRRAFLRRLSPCRVSVGESVAGPWMARFLDAVGCSLPGRPFCTSARSAEQRQRLTGREDRVLLA